MRLQHNIKYRLLASLMGLAVLMSADAVPTHYDTESGNIQQLFMHGSGNYVFRYHHEFNDTLYIPNGCELRFEGGYV